MTSKPTRKHFVTFESPGTFVHETTTKPIESWDPKLAVEMAEQIKERYNATPFGFYFTTALCAEPVPDGEGGALNVEPKQVAKSGRHFLGGTLETVDDVRARRDPKETILLSNMEGNRTPIIITVIRGYKSTHVFGESDCIVGPDGKIGARGDDSKHVKYRERKAAESK